MYPDLARISNIVCRPCHSDCFMCNGPSNADCQACTFAGQTPTSGSPNIQCLRACPRSSAENGECFTCHAQCNGCMGSTNGDCVTCRSSNVTILKQCSVDCSGLTNEECTFCIGKTSMFFISATRCIGDCPYGQVYDINAEHCVLNT